LHQYHHVIWDVSDDRDGLDTQEVDWGFKTKWQIEQEKKKRKEEEEQLNTIEVLAHF
jgi:hypothetical protein